MKKFIPKFIRLNFKLTTRYFKDLGKGNLNKFAKSDRESLHYNGMVETIQPIIASEYSDNIYHNIKLASKEISRLQLFPGEIFSFWKVLGKPTKGKGYKIGPSIVKDELVNEVGGGLCQLAGLMYHTALKAGLEIEERYPHTKDIFSEKKSYTPLGADAAVVYGYKDLRIKNSRGFLIKFTFVIKEHEIACRIFLEDKIDPFTTQFENQNEGDKKKVITFVVDYKGEKEMVAESEYLM